MRQADYAILAAILVVAIGICAAMFLRPGTAEGVKPVEFADNPCEAHYEPKTTETTQPEAPEIDAQEVKSGGETPFYAEAITYESDEQTAPQPVSNGVSGDPDGLNSFVGVVEWNGRTETAYSSNVLYHYRTSEWTPDEFGFYRTDDGLYVVGSDDYEMGSVIETSRGPALVADCGGDPGITDFYTNW